MKRHSTVTGFILILGLATLALVAIDALGASALVRVGVAALLASFGLVTAFSSFMLRPVGIIFGLGAGLLALVFGVQSILGSVSDLLLFVAIIFDVIAVFVLLSESDRANRSSRRPVPQPAPVEDPHREVKRAAASAAVAATEIAEEEHYIASGKRPEGSFHLVNCSIGQRVKKKDRVSFDSREDALEAGYKPCRVCNP